MVSDVAFDFFILDRFSIAKVLAAETAAREAGTHRSPETADAMLGLLAVCRRLTADPARTSTVTQTEAAAVLGLGRSAACKLWKRLVELGVDPAERILPAAAAASGGFVKVGLGEWEAVLHRARRRPRRRFAAVGVVARAAGATYSTAPVEATKLGRAGRSHPRALLADLKRSGIVNDNGRLALAPRPSAPAAAPAPPRVPPASAPVEAPAQRPTEDRWATAVAEGFAASWVATVGHGDADAAGDVALFEVPSVRALVADGRLVEAVGSAVVSLAVAEDAWSAGEAAEAGPGWRPPQDKAVARAELLGRQVSPYVSRAADPVGELARRLRRYQAVVSAA